MANTLDTKLIVEAITEGFDKVARDLHKIDSAVEDSSSSAGNASMKFTELQSALQLVQQAYQTVAQVARRAAQDVAAGAEISRREQEFRNLAESIGTTSEALKSGLDSSVGNLLSNAEKMQLAGQLISLGLAKSRSEAIQLSEVAGKLGMDMNQLVLTLTNRTTMRFDALGIAVDGFQDKVDNLELGGLGEEEAFKTAFIEQANDAIDRMGSISETSAGKVMEFENSWKNLQEAFQQSTAEAAVEDLVDATAVMEANMAGAEKAGETWGSIIGFITENTLGYAGAVELWAQAADAGIVKQEEANETVRQMDTFMLSASDAIERLNERKQFMLALLDEEIAAASSADVVMLGYAGSVGEAGNASAIAAGQIDGLIGKLSELSGYPLLNALGGSGIGGTWASPGRLAGGRAGIKAAEDFSQASVMNELNEEIAEETRLLKNYDEVVEETAESTEILTGSTGGFRSSLSEVRNEIGMTAQEMQALSDSTAGYFNQARKGAEFNPIEALLNAMEGKSGIDAMDMAKAAVEGGLINQEEANKFLGQAAGMAQADVLANMISQGMDPGEAAKKMLDFNATFEEGKGLASEFFSTITEDPKEATLSLETSMAQAQVDDFFQTNGTMNVGVNFVFDQAQKDRLQTAIEELGG